MIRLLVCVVLIVAGASAQEKDFIYDGPAFKKGLELQAIGKDREAFAQWRVVLQQQPGHPGAYYHAGVGRYNIGELDKARYNFERAFDYPDKGFNAHYYLGRIAEKEGKREEAIARFNTYLQLTKNRQGIAEVKGRIARLSEKRGEAPSSSLPPPLSASASPIPSGEKKLSQLWARAEEHRQAGRWGEALEGWGEIVERCLADQSENPLCRKGGYALADAYYEAGRLQPAAERYRMAVERWPDPHDDAWGWYQIGNASRGWNHEGALEAFSKVMQLHPSSPWASRAHWKRDDITWKLQNQDLLSVGDAP